MQTSASCEAQHAGQGQRTQQLSHALALLKLLDELSVAAGVLHVHIQLQHIAHLHARMCFSFCSHSVSAQMLVLSG